VNGDYTATIDWSWGLQSKNDDAGEYRVFITDTCDDAGNQGTSTNDNARASVDTWQHVAFVYDGSQGAAGDRVKIFTDGVERSTTMFGTIPTSLQDCSDPLDIGRFAGISGREWPGQIDDVRIYNYALSAAQIRKIMQDDAAARFGPDTGQP
jgi:hypothetical protein